MSLEVVDQLHKIILPYYDKVCFLWHGGEPLSMSMDFWYSALAYQKKYTNEKQIIENKMQTNLTLMDSEVADFLVSNNFGIGSSHDGTMNDTLRGNSNAILHGRDVFTESGGKCGFIMVVSRANIHTLVQSYEFFKQKGIPSFTINFYVSSVDNPNDELDLIVPDTIERIIEFFNYWINDSNAIHVTYFERFIRFVVGEENTVCKYTSCLGKWIGIRYDGQIMPCNRYFSPEYTFGNVMDYTEIGEAFISDGFKKLLSQAISRRQKCTDCSVYTFCCGGCNNDAFNYGGVENNNFPECEILKAIYIYIEDYITQNRNNISNPIVNDLIKNCDR